MTLVPTRGMGILRVVMGDLRLGWDSPVREVVHPKYVNLNARGGLGWLEGFNEWLARCGLEWAGHPGRDTFVNNVGEQAEMDLTLHGKVENIPASEVEVLIDREPRPRIRVRGRVDERAFYGPKLELWTEVSTEPGATTFRIDDALDESRRVRSGVSGDLSRQLRPAAPRRRDRASSRRRARSRRSTPMRRKMSRPMPSTGRRRWGSSSRSTTCTRTPTLTAAAW